MRRSVVVMLGVLTCLSPTVLRSISEPRLVADLATVPSPFHGSDPGEFLRLGSAVLFTAQPDDHARRLYRSDGTASGTELIASGCGPLEGGGFSFRFASAAKAYYTLQCWGRATSLWVSDGTSGGTRELLASTAFHDAGFGVGAARAVEDGGLVYFLQGGNYDRQLQLWQTDGSSGGTRRVAVVSESDQVAAGLHRRGPGDLLLLVEEADHSFAIWRSDGTETGTERVRVLRFEDSYPHLQSFNATASGIAFVISRYPTPDELWYSDGTDEGTLLGAELDRNWYSDPVEHAGSIYFVAGGERGDWIWRGGGSAATTRPIVALGAMQASTRSFEFVGDELYFVACTNDLESCSLLRSPLEGGVASAVAEVCVAVSCWDASPELWVRGVAERLVYTHRDEDGVSVWTSALDGSGAEQVATLCDSGYCYGPDLSPAKLDGRVFLAAHRNPASRELWSSDGTPGGTERLAANLPSLYWFESHFPLLPLAALAGDAGWIFAAGETVHGLELWRARPQADSAALVEDLRLDRPGLDYIEPVAAIGSTFVFAQIDATGDERTLFRHDVGVDGVEPFLTVPVRRGRHGSRNGPPTLSIAGNAWFFVESDLDDGYEQARQVWRYDPVSRDLRTLFAADPPATGIGARSDHLVPSGGDYLFLGADGIDLHPVVYRLRPRSGAISKLLDLPATDAISAGVSGNRWFVIENRQRIVAIDLAGRTRKVLGEFPEESLQQAVALELGALFTVERGYPNPEVSLELWQADATGTGTRALASWSYAYSGCSLYLTLPPRASANPVLFDLQSSCSSSPGELWTSDGSRERTLKLRDFPGERLSLTPDSSSGRGQILFLSSDDLDGPPESESIWKTDGTPAGTVRVASMPAGASYNYGNWERGAYGEDAYYFAWEDSTHGLELWKTDGTELGTALVKDLVPGPGSSSPSQLRTVGDQVIFGARTDDSGRELWQIGGGFDEPLPVADLYQGIEGSAPDPLAATDLGLFFVADDGLVGREIWEVSRPSVAPCVADATTLCLGNGRFRARAVRRDFAGEMGKAGVVPLTGDSGYFWFFAPGNPEVLLKIVDACGLPGFENFWAYSTGLTNVEVELEIVDTLSGERKKVRTALGEAYGPLFDSGSFAVCDFAGALSTAAAAPSTSATVLPLLDGRFEARASWKKRDGARGVANAVSISDDSGYFWFFSPESIEVLVRLADACGLPGFDNFWVFAGGLTDVEVRLEVTDTWSGEVVRHDNLQGEPFSPLLETGSLRVCE
jgi:ELWxxDGT repeat protein